MALALTQLRENYSSTQIFDFRDGKPSSSGCSLREPFEGQITSPEGYTLKIPKPNITATTRSRTRAEAHAAPGTATNIGQSFIELDMDQYFETGPDNIPWTDEKEAPVSLFNNTREAQTRSIGQVH